MNEKFKNKKELKNYLKDLEKAINTNENFYWQEDMIVLIEIIKNFISKEEKNEFDDWLIDREDLINFN